MAQQPMINGCTFAWSSITTVIGGQIIDGFTAIMYGYNTTMTNNYGRGSKVDNRTTGNEEPEASITLYFYEVRKLLNGLPPGGKLSDYPPFNIPVSYKSPEGLIVNDKIVMCQFPDLKFDMKQNDPKIEATLKLIVGDIIYNA